MSRRHRFPDLFLQNLNLNWRRFLSKFFLSAFVMFIIFITCVALVTTSTLLSIVSLLIFTRTPLWRIVALVRHDRTDLVRFATIVSSALVLFLPTLLLFLSFFLILNHFRLGTLLSICLSILCLLYSLCVQIICL